eukprot:m.42407 g.42407  ORF g.42407 m.42407 type:complete len:520 (+) comp33355_c0_seq6:18-1577(+)
MVLLSAVLPLGLFLCSAAVPSREKQGKNILFVICDSMDGRLIGKDVVHLPNLEKVAQQGIVFENAYTNNPICCPSRSALWSGLHTHITQSWNNYKGLEKGYPTWAVKLADAGYETEIIGKQDYTSGSHSVSNRVEAWTRAVNFTLRQEGRPTPKLVGNSSTIRVSADWHLVDKAKEWIMKTASNITDKPFLLYVGINLPHPSGTPAEGENFGESTFPTSPYWLKYVQSNSVRIPKWLPLNKFHPVDFYESAAKNCTSDFSQEEIFAIRQHYYAMCAETDAMFGAIVDALKESGHGNDTYIFFASDHGEMAMEHRQFYKMSMYEASSHVPLVVSGPGVPAATQSKNVTQLIDIFPTFMDIAGIEHPKGLNGSSLMAFLKPGFGSGYRDRPDYILSQYHGCNMNMSAFMLRKGQYKYVAYGNGPEQVRPHLFDLAADPDELNDLSLQNLEVVKEMDVALRSLVDYPSVSKQVDQYNRKSFKAWRESLGDKYDDTIANLRWWMDWQKDPEGNQKKVDSWLNS